MLNLTYKYKLIPTNAQCKTFDHWLQICHQVYNYALRERKDWVNFRKCDISFKRGVYFGKVDANETNQIYPRCQTHTGKKQCSVTLGSQHCRLVSRRRQLALVSPMSDCIKKEIQQQFIVALSVVIRLSRDVAAQVVLQRGYKAVGHIAVNFGEGKLHE